MPKYKARVLVNRTGRDVEFKCGGEYYEIKKGEVKAFDGFVAEHALSMVNTGLEEYNEQIEKEMREGGKEEMPDYASWEWKKLVSMASEKGVWEPGTNKQQVVKKLEEEWKNEQPNQG